MFYAFSHTLTADHSEKSPYEMVIQLTAGVIHQVDIVFQDGCNHQVFVQIFHDSHQVWPSNRGASLKGNATVISFREFYELLPGNTMLTAKMWSTLGADWKEVVIQIGLLPKKILQPLSFDELLAAATGIR
ncbi:MAG: hypothetical protein DRJ03_19705 [Chloroflexi bacterium]|nr:MAG: hypothetical protein DRJ03_19705 [Chloroflexota bacterium]